jgi:hypothetical protein
MLTLYRSSLRNCVRALQILCLPDRRHFGQLIVLGLFLAALYACRSGNEKKKHAFREIGLWFVGHHDDNSTSPVKTLPGTQTLPCANDEAWTKEYPTVAEEWMPVTVQ